MSKQVFKKVALSTLVVVCGLFLWSNIEKANARLLCIPGGKDWPDCKPGPTDDDDPPQVTLYIEKGGK